MPESRHCYTRDDADCSSSGDRSVRSNLVVADSGCCSSVLPSCCATNVVSGDDVNVCDDNNEKCDEACIKIAAAIECQVACQKEQLTYGSPTCCHKSAENPLQCPNDQAHGDGDGDDDDDDDDDDGHVKPRSVASHKHRHGDDGHHQAEACSTHLNDAIEKYTSYLASARCICRSILERAIQTERSCCEIPQVPPVPASTYSTSRNAQAREHRCDTIMLRHRNIGMKDKYCGTSTTAKRHNEPEGCANAFHIDERLSVKEADVQGKAIAMIELDPESQGARTHIVLNVTGMDCSSCANKLSRAISSIPGLTNVRVVFINSIAEFDLDTRSKSLESVIVHVQKVTGYKLTPLLTDHQTLHIIMDQNAAKLFQERLPHGVDCCDKISKTVYEIGYDPCRIGARDVLRATGNGELAPPSSDTHLDAGRRRLIWISILTSVAFVFTAPVVALSWGNPADVAENVKLIVSLTLATFVQTLAYPEFYRPAVSSLIYNRVVEMDMLVVISITAAYGYSVISCGLILTGRNLETQPLFETSTLLITLVLLGRLLAAWARKRAVASVSVRSLQTTVATLFDAHSKSVRKIDARLLQFGDIIQVQPHTQIVTDAEIIQGNSEVDESMLTGESVPNSKSVGSPIVSGTVNGGGTLLARISRLPGKNTITDIANLVEQAQASKPHIQDLADTVAGYFIPVVVTVAIIVFTVWLVVALEVRGNPAGKAVGTAISYSIAALAISCPCALGLAVPMVLFVAGGLAARSGVIIKTAGVTERGHKVTDVIFDKTGTLTQGDLMVVEEVLFSSEGLGFLETMSLIKALVNNNNHPVSQAIVAALEKRHSSKVDVQDIVSIPGCGVEGFWSGRKLRAGSPKWLNVDKHEAVVKLRDQGMTLFCVTHGATLVAVFGLKSRLRPEAVDVVSELRRRRITVHLVSGDNARAVEVVAASLNISLQHVAAEKSPAEKQEYVRKLIDGNRVTLFCGDGTNDAVAVAQADIGVQMESSSDVTRATADVVLLSGLEGVVNLLDVSQAAHLRILFNFGWSAVYNVVAILLASGAFVKVRIPPAYAGLGEIVSVAPVILAALSMPKVKGRGENATT